MWLVSLIPLGASAVLPAPPWCSLAPYPLSLLCSLSSVFPYTNHLLIYGDSPPWGSSSPALESLFFLLECLKYLK